MCYPTFIVQASEGFLPNYITSRLNEIFPKGEFEFMVDQLYTEEILEIDILMKSDTYFFKEEQDYSDFSYKFIGNVSIEGGADVPFYQ